MAAYALSIFLGAFLLFQVQPLIGKYILPWFGGGPGVWTTCMLFFQVLLLGGYAYAHFTARWLKPRGQALLHACLLVAALAWLPIIPRDAWKPHGEINPTLQILMLLGATIGVPYFVLSSTGPLMQHWFTRQYAGRSPYRLYALSNAGSLLALLSYPFFFEPQFTRRAQAGIWGCGLVAYAAICGFCAFRIFKSQASRATSPVSAPAAQNPGIQGLPHRLRTVLWLLLPASASALLLAITNKLCQDVAVIPFLWVVPLALYLLSFIICFDSPRWYQRVPFTLALVICGAAICWVLFQGTDISLYKQIVIYSGGLFVCCMVCHGELYRLRPEPSRLTAFYLMIAAGGAFGGIFVAVLAPILFTDYFELHWALFLTAFFFLLICATERNASKVSTSPQSPNSITTGFLGLLRRVFSPTNEWRLLACILPFLVFAGLDWFVARFGHDEGDTKSRVGLLRIAIWALLALLVVDWILRKRLQTFRHWRVLGCLWLLLGLMALGISLWMQSIKTGGGLVSITRNFYGVLMVFEHEPVNPKSHYFLLQHGRITHGIQFVDPQQSQWPTSYYGEDSGVGLAMKVLPQGPRRVGVIGLGAGTLAAYGRAGDNFRFYEINPEVRRLATSRFTFLSNCMSTAKVDVVLGDARLSLEQEPPQSFDLLALDAFSSDAIPVHLLTKQAFELYERHLKTNGIIAVHISNHYLDLEPVVANLAHEFNYRVAAIDYDESDDEWWLYSSTWILLTRDNAVMNFPPIRAVAYPAKTKANLPLWTDDFASLFQILKH